MSAVILSESPAENQSHRSTVTCTTFVYLERARARALHYQTIEIGEAKRRNRGGGHEQRVERVSSGSLVTGVAKGGAWATLRRHKANSSSSSRAFDVAVDEAAAPSDYSGDGIRTAA